MTKEQEISVLQSLKGDTYFADFFGASDIDQMCENIKHDFKIEHCCQFYQKADYYRFKMEEGIKKSSATIHEFVKELIFSF